MTRASDESVAIARHISTFLNVYAPSQKTKSDYTLRSYEYAISLYLGFLETQKKIIPESLCGECFCVDYIEDWLVWIMEQRGCGPGTCNNRLASLRVFLKYLGKKDVSFLRLSQEASQIPRKKQRKKKVSGMSKKAVQTLLAMPDVSTKTGRRDLALMITIYSTAARLDEVLSLEVRHLHLDAAKPYITVIGKGDKIRTLYLLPKASAHLGKYIEEHHGADPNPDALVFYSRNLGQFGKLSQTAVSKRLSIHAATAHKICKEVPLGLHAHQLRHAKASHWLEDGMNIVQISFLLGHEHLNTTMVYLDVTTEEEAKALATLEDENEKSVSKKWKYNTSSLSGFCGVRSMKPS
jgi:site-specific recombinase XerD